MKIERPEDPFKSARAGPATARAIQRIEAESVALNLTLGELCRLAEVSPASVSRWRAGRNALSGNFNDTVAALEAALVTERARLRAIVGAAA